VSGAKPLNCRIIIANRATGIASRIVATDPQFRPGSA